MRTLPSTMLASVLRRAGEIAIEERPVVRQGAVVPASMMAMTLSCDHRILYGADGAKFLARVRQILEQPLSLAL